MATNKNATIRYNALDKCLSNQFRKFFIKDLIDYCSEVLTEHYGQETRVSRRQVYDDLNFMKSIAGFEAPIVSYRDGRKTYYRYSEKDFSIQNKPISSSEIAHLREAMETLSRLGNLQGFDWVNSLNAKINAGLDMELQDRQVISFAENEFLKGLEFLNPLYNYIINNQCIKVKYRGFKSTANATFTISPHYLKQYNNRWFLLGYNHMVKKIQTLALDRIVSLSPSKKAHIPTETDFNEYFEDIVGVTRMEAPLEKIKIKLTDDIKPYISSKPLHGSQKISGNILTLELIPNYELESLILGHGENMEVLEPQSLISRIKERIKGMQKNYLK